MVTADANGNTFMIYSDSEWEKIQDTPYHEELFRYICVDSALVIGTDTSSSVHMRIIESDGSESNMCGNGLLAVAKFLQRNKITSIRTRSWHHKIKYDEQWWILAEIGEFHLRSSLSEFWNTVSFCDVGEPHAVMFVSEKAFRENGDELLRKWAEKYSFHEMFGTTWNFSIATIKDERTILARTFERWVNHEMESCGTWASCIATLGSLNTFGDILSKRISVQFPKEILQVHTGKVPKLSHIRPIQIKKFSQIQ